ncbi:MAG: hypothetical protein ACFFG0_04185 [Candidatus Thorarchaeota archaeon]
MKIIRLIVAFLFLFIISCATIPQNKIPAYDFDFYSHSLSKNLFPKINNTLKPYNRFLSEDEAQEIVNKVSDIIFRYLKDNNLYVSRKPDIAIYKLDDGKYIAFVVRIEIHFLDKESSYKHLINTLIIVKKFLVFFGPKKLGVGV